MNRIIRITVKYLIYSFPAVVLLFLWGMLQTKIDISWAEHGAVKALIEVLSWQLILWFIVLIVFLFALTISPRLRNESLARLSGMKERDERESVIAGRSARFSYLATLALMTALFFFSVVNITVVRIPDEKAVDGKHHSLSIGMGFDLVEDRPEEAVNKDLTIFSTYNLPLSKEAVLLILIIWHVGAYQSFSRKQLRD